MYQSIHCLGMSDEESRYPREFIPVIIGKVMSFPSLLPLWQTGCPSCQEIRTCDNSPVYCHLMCTQRITIVVVVKLASLLATPAPNLVFSSSLLVSFLSRPVLRWCSRQVISACLGSASHVIPLRGCHLTIGFSTLTTLARSSSSPRMVIFVSNVFFKNLAEPLNFRSFTG